MIEDSGGKKFRMATHSRQKAGVRNWW